MGIVSHSTRSNREQLPLGHSQPLPNNMKDMEVQEKQSAADSSFSSAGGSRAKSTKSIWVLQIPQGKFNRTTNEKRTLKVYVVGDPSSKINTAICDKTCIFSAALVGFRTQAGPGTPSGAWDGNPCKTLSWDSSWG